MHPVVIVGSENLLTRLKHKSTRFKQGLETLSEDYSHYGHRVVDAWMDKYFQLGDNTVAATASAPQSAPGEHLTKSRLSSPDCFVTPRQAVNVPASPSTVLYLPQFVVVVAFRTCVLPGL